MKKYNFLLISCTVWFIFLCFLHYFSARPLWLDENFIFGSIKNFTPAQILGPLKSSQAFPRIYLIIIKIFSQGFGYSVFSLRFFPLVSMLCAFFIWAKIYKEALLNKWHFLLVLFSFAGSYSLSYYAAELKPYSLDVLVVGIFCLYLSHQERLVNKGPSKLFIVGTLMLPVTLFLSYGSFFVFWIVSYNFLLLAKKNHKVLPLLIGYTAISLLFVSLVYFYDLRHGLGTRALFDYWNDYFLCVDSFYCFIKSFGEGLRKLSVWWFGNSAFFRRVASPFIPVFVLSMVIYGVKAVKKCKFKLLSIDAIGLIIFLELIIFGLLKKYPFTGERVTLFFAPFVFYFIVKGIASFRSNKLLYTGFNIFYIVFFFVCGINSFLAHVKFY